MKFPFTPRPVLLFISALLLSACAAATKPIGEWRDEGFTGHVDNIMVLGITTRSTRRRVFEDLFVQSLATLGVNATPSYQLITSTLNLTREQVENAIRGRGYGAVLVTRVVGVKQEEVYRRPANYDHYNDFYEYYDHVLEETSPGYHAQFRVVTLETNLWDTTSGELIWQLKSEAMDRSQPRHILQDQIDLTINTLVERGLIASSP